MLRDPWGLPNLWIIEAANKGSTDMQSHLSPTPSHFQEPIYQKACGKRVPLAWKGQSANNILSWLISRRWAFQFLNTLVVAPWPVGATLSVLHIHEPGWASHAWAAQNCGVHCSFGMQSCMHTDFASICTCFAVHKNSVLEAGSREVKWCIYSFHL